MKNKNIMYDSTEKTPVVLPEMEELLPPLTEEQMSVLERDILRNGCYSPIIVNQDRTQPSAAVQETRHPLPDGCAGI